MQRRLGLILGVVLLLLGSSVQAAEPDGEVRLSIERYHQLIQASQRRTENQPSWGRAQVIVDLSDAGRGQVEVEMLSRLDVVGGGVAEVALIPADAALRDVQVNGNRAGLIRSRGMHTLLLPEEVRTAQVRLRFLAPVRVSEDGERVVLLPLPPVPGSTLTVHAGENADTLRVWPGVGLQRKGATVSATLPSAAAVVLRWGRGGKAYEVRRVSYELTPDGSGDGMDVVAIFEVVLTGPVARVPVAHADVALIESAEGDRPLTTRVVDRWQVAALRGKGRHRIRIRFRSNIDRSQAQPQVKIELSRAPITSVHVTVAGNRTVTFEPSVPLQVRTSGSGEALRTRAEGYLPPTDHVVVRWTEPRAAPEQLVRINTETFQLITLQEGVIRSRVFLRYQVIRGRARELVIQIPEGIVPYRILGEGIEDWRTFPATDDRPRQIRLMLDREREGEFNVELHLEAVAPREEGADVVVPVVRPLGIYRETGVVALFDGEKVGFSTVEQEGYAKVGEDALPVDIRQGLTDKVRQAFKHIGAPGVLGAKVSSAIVREVRFDARLETLYLVKEGVLIGNTSILVEMKSGRRDTLMLTLPDGVNVLSVSAPSLNKAEPAPSFEAGEGRKGHRVRFTRALEGAIQVEVEFEVLLPKDLGTVMLPDVRLQGAEVEEGSFGIAAETGIEVQQSEMSDLRRVDVQELPRAVRLRSNEEILLAYQFAHGPWSLQLDVRRHRTVETLKAVASPVWIETNLLDDGHMVSRATFQVTNDDRQFLRLVLPPNARVWTVAAGGVSVKAVADEHGALAIPLPKGAAVQVDVVYELRRDRLGVFSSVDLQAPKADLLMTDVKWLVRIPAKLAVLSVDTDLQEVEVYDYSSPGELETLRLPERLSPSEEVLERVFAVAVQDPSEEALRIDLRLVARPAGWIGGLVGLAGLLLFLPFLTRRVRGRRPGRMAHVALVAAVLLLAAKAALWGLSMEEGTGVAVVLAGVGIAVALIGRRRDRAEARNEVPA